MKRLLSVGDNEPAGRAEEANLQILLLSTCVFGALDVIGAWFVLVFFLLEK